MEPAARARDEVACGRSSRPFPAPARSVVSLASALPPIR